jgi:hypothetical protein
MLIRYLLKYNLGYCKVVNAVMWRYWPSKENLDLRQYTLTLSLLQQIQRNIIGMSHICRRFEGSDFALQVAYGPGNRKAPSADQYNFPPRQDHSNSFLIPTDIRSSSRERTGVPHGRVNYLAVHKSFDFRGGSLWLNHSIHDPVTIEAWSRLRTLTLMQRQLSSFLVSIEYRGWNYNAGATDQVSFGDCCCKRYFWSTYHHAEALYHISSSPMLFPCAEHMLYVSTPENDWTIGIVQGFH